MKANPGKSIPGVPPANSSVFSSLWATFSGGLGVVKIIGVPSLIWYFLVDWSFGWPGTVGGAVLALPLIYLGWLMIALLYLALESALMSKGISKPTRMEYVEGGKLSREMVVTLVSYLRYRAIYSWPFVSYLKFFTLFSYLIHRAYSPSVHIRPTAKILGRILDPDITWIGNNVITGEGSRLVAHALNALPGGRILFMSAPIRIGDDVTVGGDSLIEMGTVIGDGAIVQSKSHVKPYTRIGAGEVWGGSPAEFQYWIGDDDNLGSDMQKLPGVDGRDARDICALVARALNVPEGNITAQTLSGDMEQWDSLGRLAISAALFDRYAVSLTVEEAQQLDSIAGVAQIVEKIRGDGRVSDPIEDDAEWENDPEWLPLLDSMKATALIAGKGWDIPTQAAQKVRVRIAATYTADALAASLESWCSAFQIDVNVQFSGFDQVAHSLLDGGSLFFDSTEERALNVVLTRPEDLLMAKVGSGSEKANILIDAICEYADRCHIPLLVSDLPPVLDDETGVAGEEVDELRRDWSKAVDALPGVMRLDFPGIIRDIGHANSRDRASLEAAAIPYSPIVFQRLGIDIARHVCALVRPAAKVIALDCDGTLWGGVMGEEGMKGIEIGPEGSDCPFRRFQTELKKLRERGILLVLASRNDWGDVERVFREHSSMVLRLDDIAAHRVNWEPKADNLQQLAEELGLTVDSFVFIDDDPHERALAKKILPHLHVMPMANNPGTRVDQLLKTWIFDGLKSTPEDDKRTEMIHAERNRMRIKEEGGGMDAYLAQLDLKVRVRNGVIDDLPRVVQLVGKTNQFNLNLKRLPEEVIAKRINEGEVRVCETWDRFGDYGLTGIAMLDPSNRVNMFLLSCRALGRGVEDAFLAALAKELGEKDGEGSLRLIYKSGPRNAPVQAFLERVGFKLETPTTGSDVKVWNVELAKVAKIPSHVTLAG